MNYFGRNAPISKDKINLFLAQKVTASFQSLKDLDSLKESYLNKINFNSFYEIKTFIIDSLTEDLKEVLYRIVLLSKTTDFINLASSNAITFLNKSGVSFVNEDFSKIKIPNADLSYGMFINTNFESGNLCGVNFSMAHLYDTSFKNCNMINADFGIKHLKVGLRTVSKCLQFSACGRFLAITVDKVIVLYDQETYNKLALFDQSSCFPSNPSCYNLNNGLKADKYRSSGYKKIAELIGHSSTVEKLLFSDNGKYLASWCKENILILWDTFSKLQIEKFKGMNPHFSFSPCNNYICLTFKHVGWYESLIKIYDINSKAIVEEIGDTWPNLMQVNFLHIEKRLIIFNGNDYYLRVWDLTTKTVVNKMLCAWNWQLAVSLNRKYITLYWIYVGTIAVHCTKTLEIIHTLKSDVSIRYFKNNHFSGNYLAWCSKNKSLKVFDMNSKEIILEIYQNKNWQNESINLHRDQLIVGTSDKRLKSWKIPLNPEINKKMSEKNGITIVSFSRDNQFFAVIAIEGGIYIFITKTQKLLKKFQLYKQKISCVAWSENILATLSHTIIIWDIYNGIPLKEITLFHKVHIFEFSPDTKKLLYCLKSSLIAIWDIDKDQKISEWLCNGICVTKCCWSRCGNFVIAACSDKSIKMLKADNLELLTELPNSNVKIDLMNISVSGEYLVACSLVKRGMIWRLPKNIKETKIVQEFCMKNVISSILWSPDGKKVFIGDVRGKIIIWDLSEGKLYQVITAHKGTVTSLHFSTTGNCLISGSKDRTVKLWNFDHLLHIVAKN